MEFYSAHIWGKESMKAAAAIKAAFLRGEEAPDKQYDLQRRCRDERIYGVYKDTTVAIRSVPALPASCSLPVPVSQPVIAEGSSVPASGEDFAATFLLPVEYHGVGAQAKVIGAEDGLYGFVVRAGV